MIFLVGQLWEPLQKRDAIADWLELMNQRKFDMSSLRNFSINIILYYKIYNISTPFSF